MREEAKRRAELYQALADGKTLQVRKWVQGSDLKKWVWCDLTWIQSVEFLGMHVIDHEAIRIKPKLKKQFYRLALYKDARGFHVQAVNSYETGSIVENARVFQSWITDWIEYELPEGEA
jgi:hypothetical protein